jgi:ferrochelatase
MSRIAVVLFNLGGPDGPKAVRPFLFNLFSDPAIIGAPAFVRLPLAALISTTRAKSARANYAMMGGGSPLLPETEAQAAALEAELSARAGETGEDETRVFVAMRYWRPFSDETARAVAAWAPNEIVLLPLYPQYSTTTSGSSLAAWAKEYRGPGVMRSVCCYPTVAGLIEAHAQRIETAWRAAGAPTGVRLLFSAHGLPQVVIGAAGHEGLGVVIAPIAFVSEHVETLVELDHEYAKVGASAGCTAYVRAPALGVEAAFIDALADVALASLARRSGSGPGSGFTCPAKWSKCPAKRAGANA